MKYFLIAGEASGDLHAAELIQQLRLRDSQAVFLGLGGDRMAAAGCSLCQHIRRMAFMGFAAVLGHLGQIRTNFRIAREAIVREKPDVLVLIDYPSFNLKMAAFCKARFPETRIYYYIPPKVWAWKKHRIHRIAKLCDEVLGIFPFEPAFYARYGYRCTYVGNPTAEQIARWTAHSSSVHKKTIAILPGSRASEISHCLPRMLEAAHCFPDYAVTVCAAPGRAEEDYRPYLREGDTLTRDTYAAVQGAAAAIVNSGTATLETALLGCPQVAVYHLACSRLIGWIRWAQPLLFSIPYFTLVNIIAGRQVIRECIANAFTVDNVAAELKRLLTDKDYQQEMSVAYEHLSETLGTQPAAATAAAIITSRNR